MKSFWTRSLSTRFFHAPYKQAIPHTLPRASPFGTNGTARWPFFQLLFLCEGGRLSPSMIPATISILPCLAVLLYFLTLKKIYRLEVVEKQGQRGGLGKRGVERLLVHFWSRRDSSGPKMNHSRYNWNRNISFSSPKGWAHTTYLREATEGDP